MARILETKVSKKKAKIKFEFEHNGKTHQRTSTLDSETFWKLSPRERDDHIRIRANHEREKIDTPRKKAKKEEQKDERSLKDSKGRNEGTDGEEDVSSVETGLGQQPDLEEE